MKGSTARRQALALVVLLPIACCWRAYAQTRVYRLVRSDEGFRTADGTVRLPSRDEIYGVGGDHPGVDECAYNYLAIHTEDYNIEVGMKSEECDGERWWGFRTLNGPEHWNHLMHEGARWPRGDGSQTAHGAAPGSEVFMRIYVGTVENHELDGHLACRVESDTAVYENDWPCPGATQDGADQHFVRNTVLIVRDGQPGMSHNNNWSDLRVYDQTQPYAWDAERVPDEGGEVPTEWTPQVRWYPPLDGESIDIQRPQLGPE